MWYSVYEIWNNRFWGYWVSTICEHPDCNKEIDRWMSYACWWEPFSEKWCDRYFCEKHTNYVEFDSMWDMIKEESKEDKQGNECYPLCERCAKNEEPFNYKPESKEWLEHIISDESWEIWREKNPKILKTYKEQLGKS